MFVLIALTVSLLATACSSSSLPPADELPELEFGKGELPITVPEDFPLPEGATIGSTMIDGSRTLTEFVFIAPMSAADVVGFYETELPEAGYEVTATREESLTTIVDFIGNGIDGSVSAKGAGATLTEGFVSFVYSS